MSSWFKRAMRRAGHTIDRVTKGVTRTVKKVPGVGNVVKFAEHELKGPLGKTFHAIMSNPFVDTVFGPIAIPANLAYGAATDGVRGATRAAKAELRNPVRQAVVKAAAVIFPPVAPAAVALEAANRVLDAAEKGSPAEMAKAAAQIAANVALGDQGDELAKKTLATIDQARDLRAKAAGVVLPMRKIAKTFATDHLSAALVGEDAHAAINPARFQAAVAGLAKAARGEVPVSAVQKHADLVAATLHAAQTHRTPLFSLLGTVAHGELAKLDGAANPNARAVLNLVEKNMVSKTLAGNQKLNRFVLAFNAGHPAAQRSVSNLKAKIAKGDPASAARYDQLRRRTAALKKAGEYHVDATGMVRHTSNAAPAKPALRAR